MAIVSGLLSSPVSRLKDGWKHSTNKKAWEKLQKLVSMEENFKFYRRALKRSRPPCVPLLGVMLKDFMFLDEGNPTVLPPESVKAPSGSESNRSLLNWQKVKLTAKALKTVQHFQRGSKRKGGLGGYALQPVEFIQEYLLSVEVLDQDALYAKSLEIEPREKR